MAAGYQSLGYIFLWKRTESKVKIRFVFFFFWRVTVDLYEKIVFYFLKMSKYYLYFITKVKKWKRNQKIVLFIDPMQYRMQQQSGGFNDSILVIWTSKMRHALVGKSSKMSIKSRESSSWTGMWGLIQLSKNWRLPRKSFV